MAPAAQQYVLVGFTEELDWKPLHFVKPLPRNRLCSVCGLVHKTATHLSCGHVACSSCYEQCRTAGGYTCPIDGENCPEEDADWRDFPAEKLLSREVKCWNERHGCPLRMAASEVHKHFHRECEHHCTSCPRCSAIVLCRDMGKHLSASCNTHGAPQATECEVKPGDAVVTEILEGVRKVVKEEAGEMKALLERLFGENITLNDSLTEVCQSVNVFKESVREEIASEVFKQTSEVCQSVNSLKEIVSQGIAPVGQISEMTHRVLDGINTLGGVLNSEMTDIKKQNAEQFPRVRAAIDGVKEDAGSSTKRMLELQKKALAYAEKNETRCDFFVPGMESLEAKALKFGEGKYIYGQVYLRGYNISPGVLLEKSGENVLVKMRLQLNKGDHDDDIPWPFDHKLSFTVLHPSKNEDKALIHKFNRHISAYQKENIGTRFAWVTTFNLGNLKRGGYISNDMLRVTWELL